MLHAGESGTWATIETIDDACAKVRRSAARQADSARSIVAAAVRVEAAIASAHTSPRAETTLPPDSDEPAATLDARPLRVLLVEDNDDTARAAWRVLTHDGCAATRVSSGDEALCMLSEQPPWDAVVVDLHLGAGMLGTAVLREAASLLKNARLIIWTALLFGAELEAARVACGAHYALEKGRSARFLVAAIRGLEVPRET